MSLVSVADVSFHYKVKIKFQCHGTHCDEEQTEVIGDYAIVTTPAPLTTSMKFSPKIELTQWHGMQIMKYLTPVKVILVFRDRWWENTHTSRFEGGITTDMNFQQLWFPPEQPTNGEHRSHSHNLKKIYILWS